MGVDFTRALCDSDTPYMHIKDPKGTKATTKKATDILPKSYREATDFFGRFAHELGALLPSMNGHIVVRFFHVIGHVKGPPLMQSDRFRDLSPKISERQIRTNTTFVLIMRGAPPLMHSHRSCQGGPLMHIKQPDPIHGG